MDSSANRAKGPLPVSDSYLATMMALGPGLGVCAFVYWFAETDRSLASFLRVPVVYGAFVLGALPGLPALGSCLPRAFPGAGTVAAPRPRLAWIAASLAAPLWHIGLLELANRLFLGEPLEEGVWPFVLRYGFCLWAATLVVWLNHQHRRPFRIDEF